MSDSQIPRSFLQDKAGPDASQNWLASLHILIVDDDEINRKLLSYMLTHRVRTLTLIPSGAEALAIVQSGEVDLVIMDLRMPDMDGWEVIGAIRQMEKERARHIPIIATTANTSFSECAKALEAGADTCLNRPFSAGGLLSAMRPPDV